MIYKEYEMLKRSEIIKEIVKRIERTKQIDQKIYTKCGLSGHIYEEPVFSAVFGDDIMSSVGLEGIEINNVQDRSVCLNSVSDVSETNLQEEGVDEGSNFQHDGINVLLLKNKNKLLLNSFDNLMKDNKTIKDGFKSIESNDGITLDLDFNVNQFHIKGNKIIVVGSKDDYGYKKYKNNMNIINIYTFDSKGFKLEETNTITGKIDTTRVIGDKVYIVNEYIAYIDKSDSTKNNFFPELNSKSLLNSSKVILEDCNKSIYINVLLSINLENYKKQYRTLISDKLTTKYFSPSYALLAYEHDSNDCTINSFKISKKLSYKGKVSIKGNLLNSFALSEKDGIIRTATTYVDRQNANNNKNFLYTIKINKSKVLDTYNGFGKDRETINGIRFYKDIAYIVTFEKTDPLYTFDLSEPKKIKFLGELEIPGYSKYFHQIDDKRIISLGKDANEDGIETGVLFQLFDISNLKNVKLIDKIKYGSNWCVTTPVFEDQKYLSYRPSDNLIAFEINHWGFFEPTENFLNILKIEENNLIKVKKTEVLKDNKYRTVLLTKNNTDYIMMVKNGLIRIDEV